MAQLSIGLPVFNGSQFLGESLDSLLAQTFDDFVLLISDNGSTDGTQELCKEYAAKDKRIRYFREEINRGAIWNYNRVFEYSNSEYFKWASHDDICAPTFLEQCISALQQFSEVILAYPQTVVIDEFGDQIAIYPDDLNTYKMELCDRFKKYLRLYRSPRSCNPIFGVIRSEVLYKTPLFGSFVATDQLLLGELALWGQFFEVPENLFYRRDHKDASVRAHTSDRHYMVWIDPIKKKNVIMPRWRWLWEYLSSIKRVPMTHLEKWICRLYLLEWAAWNIPGLTKDIIKAGLWPALDTFYYYRDRNRKRDVA